MDRAGVLIDAKIKVSWISMQRKLFFVIVATCVFYAFPAAFAYDTVGVGITPDSFSHDRITGISWKTDIYEFENNAFSGTSNIPLRIEFNSLGFTGEKGAVPAGIGIQNMLHKYAEGSCNVDSMEPGLGLYFTSMDQEVLDSDTSNDIIVGVKLDGQQGTFPDFRTIYQDIDGTGVVGNNIYSNDELASPRKESPVTIKWRFNKGKIVKDPEGNLHKNIKCEWQKLKGEYREWHFSINAGGKQYSVGTFYLPEAYASYINSNWPIVLQGEHFGSCGSRLGTNKARVEYYDFSISSEESLSSTKIPNWKITNVIDDECGNKDQRYGAGTVIRSGKRRLFISVGHDEDTTNMKREAGMIFNGIDEPATCKADIECGPKYTCTARACIKKIEIPACLDSDGGKISYVKGTTKIGVIEQKDVCNGNAIEEFYCSENQIVSETIECYDGCKNGACINRQTNATYAFIHEGKYFKWYMANKTKFTEDINPEFELADTAYEQISKDFGVQIKNIPMFIDIHPGDEGGIGIPTIFGLGVSLPINSFEEEYMGIKGYWAKRFIVHEMVNAFTAEVTPGWPSDWWANHKSPFPTFAHLEVLKELNSPVGNKDIANIVPEDKQMMVFFERLKEKYGWDVYRKLFDEVRKDNIILDYIGDNPSIIRSHYTAAYLSIAAGKNLAEEMNSVGIGTFKPDVIKPYKIDAAIIDKIIKTRKTIYHAQFLNEKANNKEAGAYIEKAWSNFRTGEDELGLSYAKNALDLLNKGDTPSYTLQLKKGWNLFSAPTQEAQQTPFFSFDTDCRYKSSLWRYNKTNNIYDKATYATNSKESYWINTANDCSVKVKGNIYETENYFYSGNGIELSKGWNFFGGVPGEMNFNDIKGTCTFSKGPYSFNTAGNKWEKSSDMEPGKGYVVSVSGDCKLQQTGSPEFP